MEKIKLIPKFKLDRIREYPDQSNLKFKDFGKSPNINDYSDREIAEMVYGIYRFSRRLLIQDVFVDLEDVIKAECILKEVTYINKPTKESNKHNSHNVISNIRTFYVEDYFLITREPIGGLTKHSITRFLQMIGVLIPGRGKFRGMSSISNDYKTLQGGIFPKDLFYPIKHYINGLFFNDDYKISDFEVISSFEITAN